LDGIDSGSFLRSDANDTASGKLTLTNSNNDFMEYNGSGTSPYFRFKTSGVNNGYIQFTSSLAYFWNDRAGQGIKVEAGVSGLQWYANSNYHTVWHSGNDGSGSGLDADTVDGLQGSQFLRSDATDTASGTLTLSGAVYHTNGNTQFADYLYHYGDTDTYMRFPAADDWQVVVGGRQAIRMDEGSDPDILSLVNGGTGGATVSQTGRVAQFGTIPVLEQQQTISANYTVTNNTNAMSIGPVTVASGVTVTVGDGESWVVI